MEHPPPTHLTCPICTGISFRRELTRFPGKLVENRFKATMMICDDCSHMMFFEGWHDAEPRSDDGAML